MKLFFYRGIQPNFGDELNTWMWPRLIDGFFDEDDSSIFLGIGSIIFNDFPQAQKKIVFGAGFGGYTQPPVIDENWKFYFVRGKLTAKKLGLKESLGVGDAAILLRSCIKKKPEKRFKVSFMPHWETTFDGNWQEACRVADINYINPCDTVDNVLNQLLASELVLTEAMHGAIVSDALRVPWIAIKPIQNTHRNKWFDWASALNLDVQPASVAGSTLVESTIQTLNGRLCKVMSPVLTRLNKKGRIFNTVKQMAPDYFIERAAKSLLYISQNHQPSLSTNSAIEQSHSQMLHQLDQLIIDTGRGKVLV